MEQKYKITPKDLVATYYKLAKKTLKKALQTLALAQDLIAIARWDYLVDKIIDVIKEDDTLNPSTGELMVQRGCYCRYKTLKIWESIDRAILDLLANGSLTLVTAHHLIIGFLIRSLDKKGFFSSFREIPKGAAPPTARDIAGCGHWNILDQRSKKTMQAASLSDILWPNAPKNKGRDT